MSVPLVTIVIPTYNRARFLRDAIRSAVRQTYHNLQILVLDDASVDDTPATAAEFASDRRVEYVRHTTNTGIAGNWREGIVRARGEFFCFLHDDDTLEPLFVAELLHYMERDPELLFAFCDHWIMDRDGRRRQDLTDQGTARFKRDALPFGRIENWAESALVDHSVPVGATLFRRSMISPDFIDERALGSIDMWLLYRCAKLNLPAFYVPARLMNYRLHGGGMSHSATLAMCDGHIYRNKQILMDGDLPFLHDDARMQLALAMVQKGIHLLAANRAKDARSLLGGALRIRRDKRAAIAYGLACGGPLGAKLARAIRSG